jgi:hypothetical protein
MSSLNLEIYDFRKLKVINDTKRLEYQTEKG